jgi:hypothetical protein
MQHNKVGQAADGMFQAISGALIGFDIIVLMEFVSLPDLTTQLTVALYCFTVSLPLLGFFIFTVLIEKTRNCSIAVWYKPLALVTGIITNLVGVAMILLHLSRMAATVFVVLCIIAIIFTNIHIHFADRHGRNE